MLDTVKKSSDSFWMPIWAATGDGVVYFQDNVWRTYAVVNSMSLVFGTLDKDQCHCVLSERDVWIGTRSAGILHSQLPLQQDGIKFISVCFRSEDGKRTCIDTIPNAINHTITLTHPAILKPNELVYLEITATPLSTVSFGMNDFLRNMSPERYGAFQQIGAIPNPVYPGQQYVFTDDLNPISAPRIPDELNTYQFASTWKMWSSGKFLDPMLTLVFTVEP